MRSLVILPVDRQGGTSDDQSLTGDSLESLSDDMESCDERGVFVPAAIFFLCPGRQSLIEFAYAIVANAARRVLQDEEELGVLSAVSVVISKHQRWFGFEFPAMLPEDQYGEVLDAVQKVLEPMLRRGAFQIVERQDVFRINDDLATEGPFLA